MQKPLKHRATNAETPSAMSRRRRTDHLPDARTLPADPIARARSACDALVAAGFESALALDVPETGGVALPCATAGHGERLLDVARGMAPHAARDGRPLVMVDAPRMYRGGHFRHAAMPLGAVRDGQIVLVVADSRLSQRESEAIAMWAAPRAVAGMSVLGGPCTSLIHGLAAEFDADAILLSLFAPSGMRMHMHARSGGIVRSWRAPLDTVWAEAARHGAAFVLGDLHMHAGAAHLASVGMTQAAVVGLDNGSGVALGAIGLATTADFDVDIARVLLDRAPVISQQLVQMLARPEVPVPTSADGVVTAEARDFAARIGCSRVAIYQRAAGALLMVSAHDASGFSISTPPDELEEQLVSWAADRDSGVMIDGAAAISVGDIVVYASDSVVQPMDQLRRALRFLRMASGPADDEFRAA